MSYQALQQRFKDLYKKFQIKCAKKNLRYLKNESHSSTAKSNNKNDTNEIKVTKVNGYRRYEIDDTIDKCIQFWMYEKCTRLALDLQNQAELVLKSCNISRTASNSGNPFRPGSRKHIQKLMSASVQPNNRVQVPPTKVQKYSSYTKKKELKNGIGDIATGTITPEITKSDINQGIKFTDNSVKTNNFTAEIHKHNQTVTTPDISVKKLNSCLTKKVPLDERLTVKIANPCCTKPEDSSTLKDESQVKKNNQLNRKFIPKVKMAKVSHWKNKTGNPSTKDDPQNNFTNSRAMIVTDPVQKKAYSLKQNSSKTNSRAMIITDPILQNADNLHKTKKPKVKITTHMKKFSGDNSIKSVPYVMTADPCVSTGDLSVTLANTNVKKVANYINMADSYVLVANNDKKDEPCAKKDPCAKKEDPCAKKDPCPKKENPCAKKEDPCAKKEDPCAKKEDPCAKKEDPCAKKEDPCAKKDPCPKKEDPCAKKEDPSAKKNLVPKKKTLGECECVPPVVREKLPPGSSNTDLPEDIATPCPNIGPCVPQVVIDKIKKFKLTYIGPENKTPEENFGNKGTKESTSNYYNEDAWANLTQKELQDYDALPVFDYQVDDDSMKNDNDESNQYRVTPLKNRTHSETNKQEKEMAAGKVKNDDFVIVSSNDSKMLDSKPEIMVFESRNYTGNENTDTLLLENDSASAKEMTMQFEVSKIVWSSITEEAEQMKKCEKQPKQNPKKICGKIPVCKKRRSDCERCCNESACHPPPCVKRAKSIYEKLKGID